MAVEPVTSVKTTVTVLRLSRGAAVGPASGDPHLAQNSESSALLALQDVQVRIGEV
jgi:hypothetical protein